MQILILPKVVTVSEKTLNDDNNFNFLKPFFYNENILNFIKMYFDSEDSYISKILYRNRQIQEKK